MIGSFSIQEALGKLIQGFNLSREEAKEAMRLIMDGEATPAQIGSLLTVLRMKGETIEEITGFAETMREKSHRVETVQQNLLDTCGTGGDGGSTFNISTAAAIVASAGGIRVAKHGNRAMSSKSGSADVLEALGVNIELDPLRAKECLDQVGICFMFAQKYHQSMRHAALPRREIGFRTVFNLLGPLTNPAGADRQLIGVFDQSKTETIAFVLRELGLQRALVVSGNDGLDEISLTAPTRMTELNEGTISTSEMTPEELGLATCSIEDLSGGDAMENAQIILDIFDGKSGSRRDIVAANAGACFYVAGHCETLQEGVKKASRIIDDGIARAKLKDLIEFTGAIDHVS